MRKTRPYFLTLSFVFVVALQFASGAAFAQSIEPGSSPIFPLVDYSVQAPSLPTKFSVLVWNIQKAQNSEMVADFERLARGAELALFQEAIDTPPWLSQLAQARPDFGWRMAQSFRSDWLGYSTGVATGSRARPLRLNAALSPVLEPVSLTPKSILVNEYSIEGRSETLLVANVHAINFREQGAFESHVNQLVALIRSHRGPMIVAGDFNTWMPSRMSYLKASLLVVGLLEVPLARSGLLELDHVFVRGLEAREIAPHFDIETSDHFPISVEVVVQ